MVCKGKSSKFLTLRDYFKELKFNENKQIPEKEKKKTINNICKYVEYLNLNKEQITNVKKALLDLMKTKWNKKFKIFFEGQITLRLQNANENTNDFVELSNIIIAIISNNSNVDFGINLNSDFERCAASSVWCANSKYVKGLQKKTGLSYSEVFIEIRKIMKPNMILMTYIIEALKSKSSSDKIVKVIKKWKTTLINVETKAKEHNGYTKIQKTLSNKMLLFNCILYLKKDDIKIFMNAIIQMIEPNKCDETPLEYSKIDFEDLLTNETKTLVDIFRLLDNNKDFKGQFYEIVKNADVFDPLVKIINQIYSSVFYLNEFNHIALFLLHDGHLYDYGIKSFEISTQEYLDYWKQENIFTSNLFFKLLEDNLNKSNYNSGTVKITLKYNIIGAKHAVSLLFHKNNENKYVFNYL